HFERNLEAVRTAFMQLRVLNGLLRQQLRGMGLEVPADSILDARNSIQNGYPQMPGGFVGRSNAAPGGVGGLGGGFGYSRQNAADNYLAYQEAVTQNNFVSLNIPFGNPQPVADVLLQLGNQANVPILIDPDVPTGNMFRIDGKISPRSLPEALNVLAPLARLE